MEKCIKLDDLASVNVLIVDDERDMRHILREILQDIGVRNVHEAPDVKAALHFIRFSLTPVDLIVCDWNLPGQTGLELLQELSYDGEVPPFLIVSGRSDHDSILLAKEAGVDGYIRKPFAPEQVESRVMSALQRSKTAKVL